MALDRGRTLTLRDSIVFANRIAQRTCEACGHERGQCLHITKIVLPKDIKPGATMIAFKRHQAGRAVSAEPISWIGLTCGCYAKFHRQIAHIQDAMRRSPGTTRHARS